MSLHGAMKLGRVQPTPEQKARAPKLAKYLTGALPPAPPSADATDGVPFQLFDNDRFGNCTIAAIANYFLLCLIREGLGVGGRVFDANDVDAFYFALGHGADEGLNEHDVLDYVRDKGFPLSGEHTIAVWVRVDPKNLDEVKSLCAIFWCLYVGALLPLSAQDQPVWQLQIPYDDRQDPGSWGGHAMLLPAYDELGVIFETWGEKKRATWDWWQTYVDECYVLLDADRARLVGVDWDALVSDLKIAAQEEPQS